MLVWDVGSGRLLAEHRPRPEGFPIDDTDDEGARRRRDREKLFDLGHWFCFSADGSQFLWYFNKLRAYDTATGKVQRTFEEDLHGGYSYRGQISRDGEWVFTGGGDHGGTLFNLRQGKKRGQLLQPPGTYSGAHALSPDGRSVAVEISVHAERWITLFETATLEPRLTIPLQFNHVQGLSLSPDGRFLAATMYDRTVLIWDLRAEGI
jgi:WD40 repeat protein